MCRARIFFRISVIPIFIAFAVLAQDSAKERLDEEIRTLKREIAGMERKRASFLSSLEHLSKEERLLRAMIESLHIERENFQNETADCKTRIISLQDEIVKIKEELEDTIALMYRISPPVPMKMALADEANEKDLQLAIYYFEFLATAQSALAKDFQALSAELIEKEKYMEESVKNLSALEEELRSDTISVKQKRSQYGSMIESLGKDENLRKRALSEYERAQKTLANFFLSAQTKSVAGLLNIESFKGLLAMPVKGKIEVQFGLVEHPRFRTKVPNNGFVISAQRGTPVKAIFDGVVAFSGWFEGYGQTIILNHGNDYFSVYSHCETLLKKEGDSVAKGESVATVGDTGSLRGINLYFELRKGAQAINPTGWFLK